MKVEPVPLLMLAQLPAGRQVAEITLSSPSFANNVFVGIRILSVIVIIDINRLVLKYKKLADYL